jgi:hypothetical protein
MKQSLFAPPSQTITQGVPKQGWPMGQISMFTTHEKAIFSSEQFAIANCPIEISDWTVLNAFLGHNYDCDMLFHIVQFKPFEKNVV